MGGTSSHPSMKSWLTTASYSGMRHGFHWAKLTHLFDFGPSPAYNAALSPPNPSGRIQETPHGRPFPIQEHQAPEGQAGRPEVEGVRQAGAGNHRRRETRHPGPRHEPA